MIFADLPSGSTIFVDANTFVYAFAPEPTFGPPSFALIERACVTEIVAVTSSHVLSDVAHRLMTIEACATFAWPYKGIATRLKNHPSEVAKLVRYRQVIDQINTCGVRVQFVECSDVVTAGANSSQHGLLSGDALILAIMQRNNIANVASNDVDFDRIPGLVRFQPV